MEVKKNPEANLENKKGVLFLTGLVVALAMVLVAFEWKVYEVSIQQLGELTVEQEEEEMMPITRPELPPPPPPPPKPTEIEIVEDEEEVEEEIEIDTEMDEDMEIEIVEFEEEEVVEEPAIFTIVEEMPSFPGGDAKLFEYLGKNIKYPAMAKDAGVTGTVYVTFVVYEDGSIKDVRVLRGIGAGCDEEAIKVVKKMPQWTAGKQRGKPVRVQFNLPIRFTLK